MQYNFTIPGEPIPQKRHRTVIFRGRARTYDPQAKLKKKLKAYLISKLNSDYSHFKARCASFSVCLTFYASLPKKTSQKALKSFSENGMPPMTKRYDCDNLAKLILDAGNGILWPDDRQITDLSCHKRYTAENPRTEIVVKAAD